MSDSNANKSGAASGGGGARGMAEALALLCAVSAVVFLGLGDHLAAGMLLGGAVAQTGWAVLASRRRP